MNGQEYYQYLSENSHVKKGNRKQILDLLSQIIGHVEGEDFEYKRSMIKQNKGSNAVGEGWTLFHLKALKELLERDDYV